MKFDKKDFSTEELLRLYSAILLPRMIEEKMLVLLRQGKVSKWFSGIGQEAIAVGATLALHSQRVYHALAPEFGRFYIATDAARHLVCPAPRKRIGI